MIDLGTTVVDPAPTILGLAEIGPAANYYDLPMVLDVPPCDGAVPDDTTATRRLAALARPDWILAVRTHTENHIGRLCIAGTDGSTVVAARRPDTVVLRDLTGDPAAPVVEVLGPSAALQFDPVNVPTHDLTALCDAALSGTAAARRLVALGVPERSSGTLATALQHNVCRAQVVGIVDGIQFPEHLTVIDTRTGRLLVVSTLAADGVRWSSLTPATTSRIGQAVRALIDGTRRFSRSGRPAPG